MAKECFKKTTNLPVMAEQDLNSLKKKFGKSIKKVRMDKGLSLWDVAYNCALDASKIAKIEKGQFNITLRTINELSKGLNESISKLFDF